jgi:hypothetical protein
MNHFFSLKSATTTSLQCYTTRRTIYVYISLFGRMWTYHSYQSGHRQLQWIHRLLSIHGKSTLEGKSPCIRLYGEVLTWQSEYLTRKNASSQSPWTPFQELEKQNMLFPFSQQYNLQVMKMLWHLVSLPMYYTYKYFAFVLLLTCFVWYSR